MSNQKKKSVQTKAIEPPAEIKEVVDKILAKVREQRPKAPQIADTLKKAKAVIKAATKVKQKQRQTWRCSNCGTSGIQLCDDEFDGDKDNHFTVVIEDDEPVKPNGKPLNHNEVRVMNKVCRNGKPTGRKV